MKDSDLQITFMNTAVARKPLKGAARWFLVGERGPELVVPAGQLGLSL